MAETVREQIMATIAASFKAIARGQPADDPYFVQWSEVSRAPLRRDVARRKNFSLGVYDPTEEAVPGMGNMQSYYKLHVVLEWLAMVDKDTEPATAGNRIIGEIKRRLQEDRTWGGFSLNTTVLGDALNIDDENDRQIDGVLDIEVLYRCSVNDPRKLA